MSSDSSTVANTRPRRHRQLCKDIQKRYRASKKAANHRLALEVAILQQQTQALTLSLERGQRWGAQESAVAEYFRLLARGYDKSERHDAYFRFLFSPDVRFNDHDGGLEPLIKTLTMYSDLFASNQVEALRIEAICHDTAENDEGREMCVVEAWASAHLEIDWKTVDALFPRLRQDLVARLVGTAVILPIRYSFVFDDQVRVVRHTSEANIVQALYELFGNVHDVSTATQQARIKSNAELVPS